MATVAVVGALAALAVASEGSKVAVTVSGKDWLIKKDTYSEDKLVAKDNLRLNVRWAVRYIMRTLVLLP